MVPRTIAATRNVKVAALHDHDQLTSLVERACLIARDAVFNAKDLVHNSSRMAYLAVRDCEKELDQMNDRAPHQSGTFHRTRKRTNFFLFRDPDRAYMLPS